MESPHEINGQLESRGMIGFLLASRNLHKAREIRAILGDSYRYLTMRDVSGAPYVDEDADTFAGNATKKAVELAHWLDHAPPSALDARRSTFYVLADDSGLEVDALNGAPGVHSARFASSDTVHSGNTPDAGNNTKLLRLLEGIPSEKRTARFRCVLALVEAVPHAALPVPCLFEGVCDGRIGLAPRGRNGFGYDPLFIPEGYGQSFGELGDEVKNRLSHRARALAALRDQLSRR